MDCFLWSFKEFFISGWFFFCYMVIGGYVGVVIVGVVVWWFMYVEDGFYVNYSQLIYFMQCIEDNVYFEGVDCEVFEVFEFMIMVLFVLVIIEMCNVFNSLFENQFLLWMLFWVNIWLVGFICFFMFLYFFIFYVDFLLMIFKFQVLDFVYWFMVFKILLLVIGFDEIFKFIVWNYLEDLEDERRK